jgi:hypothetical protein
MAVGSLPSQLAWCGREYEQHGAAYALLPPVSADRHRDFRVLGSVRLPLGLPHDVVDAGALDERWTCADQRDDVLTVTYLFVRVGDRYLRYDLVGGP